MLSPNGSFKEENDKIISYVFQKKLDLCVSQWEISFCCADSTESHGRAAEAERMCSGSGRDERSLRHFVFLSSNFSHREETFVSEPGDGCLDWYFIFIYWVGVQYVRFAELGTNTSVSDTDGSGTEAQLSVPARWSISAHRARPEGAQKNQKARRSPASKEWKSCFKQRLDLILATGKVF